MAVRAVDGVIVEIEADITSGLPGVHLVGLPDTALQESRDRVRAAITNCGNEWPMSRLTLALSPATLRKVGSVYDVALAAAVLSAHTKTAWARLEKSVLLGELALDGRIRPVHGVLPAVLAAKQEGWPVVVVPVDNLAEASLVDGIEVWGCARCVSCRPGSTERGIWWRGWRRRGALPSPLLILPMWSVRPRRATPWRWQPPVLII